MRCIAPARPRCRHPARSRRPRGFTLVELLAVIAIIGVLASITLVTIGRVRESAHSARCGSNIRQIQALAALWARDNHDWCPQAMWSLSGLGSLRAGATNLRAVGYTDDLGKCDSSDIPGPDYGINNNLVSGGSNGQWGANYVQYYEHGRYKMSAIQSTHTLFFTETTYVSGYSLNKAGAYMSATVTLGFPHNDKCHVSYADGHIELQGADYFNTAAVWTKGITQP